MIKRINMESIKNRKRKYTLLFCLIFLVLNQSYVMNVYSQEYDPNTFNNEQLSFSDLGGFSPSNTINESLPGNTNRSVTLLLNFDIPDPLFQLENDLPIEYGLSITLSNIIISPNTTVILGLELNGYQLDWSMSNGLFFSNQSTISLMYHTFSTRYEEDIAFQENNLMKLDINIYAANITSASVRFAINEDNSFITVNRVRGAADIPSILLTLLFFLLFVYFLFIFPIWLYGSLKYGWSSPIPFTKKFLDRGDGILRQLTRHDSRNIQKCPSCKYIIEKDSFFCPKCGLDLELGINGIFRVIPFSIFKITLPYLLGFAILPFVIFLPNMAFPIISSLMVLSILIAGETLVVAKPTFKEFRENFFFWEQKSGTVKKLFALIMLAISILSYFEVFLPSFAISFPVFLIIVYIITKLSSSIETADTRLLLQKYQRDLVNVDKNLDKWEKGGRLRKTYMRAIGRSEEKLSEKRLGKITDTDKKQHQLEDLEKAFIETQKEAFDIKRTLVYAEYGITWFSGSLLAFTLLNTYRKSAPSLSLPTFGLPLSRLGFIDSGIFLLVHIMLFTGILLYCFIKDPLKPGLTFIPNQKLKFTTVGKKTTFICSACENTSGVEKTKKGLFDFRKKQESIIDYAEKSLTPCNECGKWVGNECLLHNGEFCLDCHPYCPSCGTRLDGKNQSVCVTCNNTIGSETSIVYCLQCGKELAKGMNYCYNCGSEYSRE